MGAEQLLVRPLTSLAVMTVQYAGSKLVDGVIWGTVGALSVANYYLRGSEQGEMPANSPLQASAPDESESTATSEIRPQPDYVTDARVIDIQNLAGGDAVGRANEIARVVNALDQLAGDQHEVVRIAGRVHQADGLALQEPPPDAGELPDATRREIEESNVGRAMVDNGFRVGWVEQDIEDSEPYSRWHRTFSNSIP